MLFKMAKLIAEINPNKYMQMAIDAMMLSVDEPRDEIGRASCRERV